MSIIDWICNRPSTRQRKNQAFHNVLDGMMYEMRRDICMACGERAGEPYDGGGYKPTICGLCRSLLEVKCHPKIPEHMCDEYLRMWGTPEAVEAFLEEARQSQEQE